MNTVKTNINKKENTYKPEIKLNSESVIITCQDTCQECQFSIADELGRIVKKGILKGESTVSFQGITPGYYQLIIFNEFNRYNYPIKID